MKIGNDVLHQKQKQYKIKDSELTQEHLNFFKTYFTLWFTYHFGLSMQTIPTGKLKYIEDLEKLGFVERPNSEILRWNLTEKGKQLLELIVK